MPKTDPFGIAIVLVIAMLVLATTTLVHAFGASSGKRHGS
jgi:hypothetical protein